MSEQLRSTSKDTNQPRSPVTMPRKSSALMSGLSRDTVLNLAGLTLPVVIALISAPFYLNTVGDARYGLLTLMWVTFGYFGMFDMGMGRAVAHRMAKLDGASYSELATTFWTALTMNMVVGTLGGALLLVVGGVLFNTIFKLPDYLRPEAISALPWLAAAVPITTVSAVLTGALEGRERFLTVNAIGMFGALLFQLAPLLVAVLHGPVLAPLISASVLARLACASVMLLACIKYLPVKGTPRYDTGNMRVLFRYGGWITVTGIMGPFLTTMDRLIIGAQVGVQALTYYAIPSSIVGQLTMLASSLARSLFPRFSRLRLDHAQEVAGSLLLSLAGIVTPIVITCTVLLEPFMKIWLGAEAAKQAAPVGEILLAGIWINSLAYVPNALVQGSGRPDLTAKLHVVELLPYLVALWLGLNIAGLQGAAWAWTLRVSFDAVLLMRAARISTRTLITLATGGSLVLLASYGALTLTDWRSQIASGVALVTVSFFWTWKVAPEVTYPLRQGFFLGVRGAVLSLWKGT